jgi:hypothetical protein
MHIKVKFHVIVTFHWELWSALPVPTLLIFFPGPKNFCLIHLWHCRKLRASQQIASVISQSQNRVYLNSSSLLLNVAEKSFDEGIMAVAKPTGK